MEKLTDITVWILLRNVSLIILEAFSCNFETSCWSSEGTSNRIKYKFKWCHNRYKQNSIMILLYLLESWTFSTAISKICIKDPRLGWAPNEFVR